MIERQTAYLTTIGTLTQGNFVKTEAQMQPSYVKTADGKQFSRVHIIAVIVSFNEGINTEAVLDDGTGKITARSFENPRCFSSFHLGDIVRIIGKVRAFNEHLYIIPEIIKKITNKQYVVLHKLLLEQYDSPQQYGPATELKEENVEDIPIDNIEEIPPSPVDTVMAVIKLKDHGEGVLIEEILKEVHDEKIIHGLLASGDLFEIRPGRIKILE